MYFSFDFVTNIHSEVNFIVRTNNSKKKKLIQADQNLQKKMVGNNARVNN